MAATTPVSVVTAKSTITTDAGTATRHPGVCYTFQATADPTADNDTAAGYRVGDMWVNTTTPKVLVATSVAAGAAVWTQVS